jgi:hypothetical protein
LYSSGIQFSVAFPQQLQNKNLVISDIQENSITAPDSAALIQAPVFGDEIQQQA